MSKRPTLEKVSSNQPGSSIRIVWVDIFKGLAILSVVLGHSGSPATAWIYSFHMPAFLFISGYTTNFSKYSFGQFFARRFRTLMLPFLCINLLYIFTFYIFAGFPNFSNFSGFKVTMDWFPRAFSQLFLDLNSPVSIAGPCWFLVVLFFSSLLCKLSIDGLRSLGISWTFGIGITAIVAFWSLRFEAGGASRLPFELDLALIAAPIILSGSYCAYRNILNQGLRIEFWLPLSLLISLYLSNWHWVKVDFPGRNFSPWYEILVSTTAGILVLFYLSKMLAKNQLTTRFFSYIGSRSIAILGFHFLGLKVFLWVLYLNQLVDENVLARVTPDAASSVYWIYFFLCGVAVPLVISAIIERSPIFTQFILGKDSPETLSKLRKWFGPCNEAGACP